MLDGVLLNLTFSNKYLPGRDVYTNKQFYQDRLVELLSARGTRPTWGFELLGKTISSRRGLADLDIVFTTFRNIVDIIKVLRVSKTILDSQSKIDVLDWEGYIQKKFATIFVANEGKFQRYISLQFSPTVKYCSRADLYIFFSYLE